MTMVEPNFTPAMQALRLLAADHEYLPEALNHFAETGLPLFVVDNLATNATGDLAVTYRLSDRLQTSLGAEITPAMIDVGLSELTQYDPEKDSGVDLVKRIFLAMKQAAETEK